ncbi:MAG: hypothetical protein GXP60_03630 [Epsilonproteobacteria bacterium]|nr:hypothetical protein [Campylobacterota bacterium]
MIQKRSIKTLAAGIIFAAAGFGILIYTFGITSGRFDYEHYGRNFATINENALDKMYMPPKTDVKINKSRNSIEFYGQSVSIPIIASPKNAADMYAFGIYGLINPTIIVRKNTKITIRFVNEDDDMYHNVAVVNDRPPYPYMSMMIGEAFENSFVSPVPEASGNKYPVISNSFTASRAGTFYYICQIMGHASRGMYGKLVVLDNLKGTK